MRKIFITLLFLCLPVCAQTTDKPNEKPVIVEAAKVASLDPLDSKVQIAKLLLEKAQKAYFDALLLVAEESTGIKRETLASEYIWEPQKNGDFLLRKREAPTPATAKK